MEEISKFITLRNYIQIGMPTVKDFEMKYKDKDIPRPSHWNGYLVMPNLIEFWQEMPFRVHDRVLYFKSDNSWKIKKLYP